MVQAERTDRGFSTICTCLTLIIITFACIIGVYFFYNWIYASRFDVALVRKVKMYPNHEGMGDIQVTNIETDQIGIIDGTNFGIKEAHVICKHFGFSKSAHAYTIKESFKSKVRPDFIIKELKCNGDEERIEYCSYEVYDPKVILSKEVNIAGVVCVSNCKLLSSIL